MDTHIFSTPIGMAKIEGHHSGISSFKIIEDAKASETPVPESLIEAVSQIRAYFSKELNEFSLKLSPEGTEFEQLVWETLGRIPYGKTISYLELSRQLNMPKAIRAVAKANGKNPLWILVPCHRVIGSDGSLTGYAGGLWRKQWLLEHESGIIQKTLF